MTTFQIKDKTAADISVVQFELRDSEYHPGAINLIATNKSTGAEVKIMLFEPCDAVYKYTNIPDWVGFQTMPSSGEVVTR